MNMSKTSLANLFFLLLVPFPCLSAKPTCTVEISVNRLDCAEAPEDVLQDALKGAAELLRTNCGLVLRVKKGETIEGRPEWCALPWDFKARLRACEAFTYPVRRKEPWRLSLFLVPRTQDSMLSWTQVKDDPPLGPCGPAIGLRERANYGSVFFTDLCWEAIRQHDLGPQASERPWRKILLAHEIVHALTQRNHPTGQRDGNLMADGLAKMGTAISEEQCECMRKSVYVKKR